MSLEADLLDCFAYELIFEAKTDHQKSSIYHSKFDEILNKYQQNRLKIHNFGLNVNFYQPDICFLLKSEKGIRFEECLCQIRGKPKTNKKKLKTIGPFFYLDGLFKNNENLVISILKVRINQLDEDYKSKYRYLEGYIFVHIFDKIYLDIRDNTKRKRSRNLENVDQCVTNQLRLPMDDYSQENEQNKYGYQNIQDENQKTLDYFKTEAHQSKQLNIQQYNRYCSIISNQTY